MALAVLLACTAVLYLWHLSVSGWGNTDYAAAAQAGAESWRAFFFGTSDPQAFITVDKPPAAIWLMALSVRLFGLSSFSILLPQAVLGVASVAVIYATVRRVRGMSIALIAGAVLATTPITTLIFRYNNPDALLVFLITCVGYCCVRYLHRGAIMWAIGIGIALGLAFLTKQLQSLLVVPGLAAAMLVSGTIRLPRRLLAVGATAVAFIISAGWWVALVTLIPPSDRPYVGGSQTNSFLDLTFGYNGIQRLTGSRGSGLQVVWEGFARLTTGAIGWLLPAAVILGAAAIVVMLLEGRHREPVFGLLVFGLVSIFVISAALTMMAGIYHTYYTVAMAPAIAIVGAIGAGELWRYRAWNWARALLAAASGITSVIALSLLLTYDPLFLFGFVLVAAAAATTVASSRAHSHRFSRAVASLAIVTALIGPLMYSINTASLPHSGSGPLPGPFPGHSTSQKIPTKLEQFLRDSAGQSEWVAATLGSPSAAELQLESRQGILPIGGYKKSDPAPTFDQFVQMVSDHRIRWFIDNQESGSGEARQIGKWVRASFPSTVVGNTKVYDLFHAPRPNAMT